jgi:hypothetical protein
MRSLLRSSTAPFVENFRKLFEGIFDDTINVSERPNPTSRIRNPKKSYGGCKLLEYHGMGDRKTANSAVVEQTPLFSNLSQSA